MEKCVHIWMWTFSSFIFFLVFLFFGFLPYADGVSHSHTPQQWPGTCTNLGKWHTAVSLGGGKFSFGQSDEQACRPFYKREKNNKSFKKNSTTHKNQIKNKQRRNEWKRVEKEQQKK